MTEEQLTGVLRILNREVSLCCHPRSKGFKGKQGGGREHLEAGRKIGDPKPGAEIPHSF